MDATGDRRLVRAVTWKRLDVAGAERCELWGEPEGWRLAGTVALERPAIEVRYEVRCDAGWRTRSVLAVQREGARVRELELTVDEGGLWRSAGEEIERLRGCVDVDLQITPATNSLPIRRLELAVGAASDVTAAWVRFPELEIAVLEQRYERLGPSAYRYASPGFAAELEVDELGLVVRYGDLWERVG